MFLIAIEYSRATEYFIEARLKVLHFSREEASPDDLASPAYRRRTRGRRASDDKGNAAICTGGEDERHLFTAACLNGETTGGVDRHAARTA